MNKLIFRRQFIFSPKQLPDFDTWKKTELHKYFLYVHPDCEMSFMASSHGFCAAVGYILSPDFPQKTTKAILSEMFKLKTIDEIIAALYLLSGRFVLIFGIEGNVFLFNDACGHRTLYYTNNKTGLYAASQPLLLVRSANVQKSVNYQQYFSSDYVRNKTEHIMPAGISLYENTHHLTANHYYDLKQDKQKRFWPNKQRIEKSPDEALEEFTDLLRKIMISASKYKLAMSLSGGVDSRIILSACKPIAYDMFVYTLQYRCNTLNSNDIYIPRELSQNLGLQHHIIDCRKTLLNDFIEIYINNTDIQHLNDWGIIANGLLHEYPDDRIAVKGLCPHWKCVFYPLGQHPDIQSGIDLLEMEPGWKDIDFINRRICEWHDEMNNPGLNCGYSLLDLFHWEHVTCEYQSSLELDIAQEVFAPFNNRALLEIGLSLEAKYRCKPDYIFFEKAMKLMWEETLSLPCNPGVVDLSLSGRARRVGISILKKLRAYEFVKKTLTKHNNEK